MGHIELLRGEIGRTVRLAGREGAAEEGELIAVFAAVHAGQVAGVVPPLGRVFLVRAVIEWKAELDGPERAGEAVVDGPG